MPFQFNQKSFCCLPLAAERTFSKRVTRCGMHENLKAWAQHKGLCETFSTEPQLCYALGPAVDVVPGGSCVCLSCRSRPPVAWLCCGCTPALSKWRWHDSRCPALPLEGGGGLLGLVQPAVDRLFRWSARYWCFSLALAFRGSFRFIFDQWSIERSLKPRESEGRWANTDSFPFSILFSLLPPCIYTY